MPYNRRRPVSKARKQKIDQQQAILQRLREGGALSGAQPATPLATFGRTATIPDLYAAQKQDVPGGEILVSKEAYSPATAELGPINTVGRTFYPAELQGKLVYVPGRAGGQYGQIFQKMQAHPHYPWRRFRPIKNPQPVETPVAPTAPVPAPVKEDVGFAPQLADYEKVRKIAAETRDPEAIKQAEELGMAIFNAKYSEENPGLIAGDRGVSFNNRPVQNPLMAKYFPERLKQPSPYGADTLAQQNEFYQADIGETFVDPPTVLRSNIFKGQPEPFTIENQPDGTPTIDPRFSNPIFTKTMESMLGADPSELMRATYSMGSGQSIETLPANTSPEAYMTQLDNKSLEVQEFMEKFLADKLGAK